MATIFYFVRHGNTGAIDPDQPQEAFRQNKDTVLDEIGHMQGEYCGMALSVLGPDALICSEYTRAIETAEEIIKYNRQLYMNKDKRLNELTRIVDGKPFFGEYALKYRKWRGEMLKNAQIHAKYDKSDQSLFEKLEEIVAFMKDILYQCKDQKVVIVTHSQVIALFLAYIDITNARNTTPEALVEAFNNRFTKNCSITTVKYNGKWSIVSYNDTKHLPKSR